MKFSIFDSVRSQKGELCTLDKYLEAISSPKVKDICLQILLVEDKEEKSKLKKQLPIVTWQAYFEGQRSNKNAQPSGLFMLDVDHVDNPRRLWMENVSPKVKECGIVLVHATPSGQGLRVVAKCRPEFKNIPECQRWLAGELGVEMDEACKDMARSSFVACADYEFYCDQSLFSAEAEVVYDVEDGDKGVGDLVANEKKEVGLEIADQREGLFGGVDEYCGLKIEDICKEYLRMSGGEPEEGERNTRLYQLATRIRYITDFNMATMLRVMPRYGLGEEEVKDIVKHAISSIRSTKMPSDLSMVIDNMMKIRKLGVDESEEDVDFYQMPKMPSLPPLLRQQAAVAPSDFVAAVVLCQLPILGTLASKLRAKYLDGVMHSPSFQVSLEAPQASGKSFLTRLVQQELAELLVHDEAEREREREYQSKMQEAKLLNIKINVDNKDEILGQKPNCLIRYVPPTISITKLLQRMYNANGLHLFAFAMEVDTVVKAFKKGFSSYSDALRVAFDNDLYGQDYASENSFSGNVNMYYNTLFSGTPAAMRRFYPDVEDGLVSRVLFVTLPDQFGKPMPVWKEMSAADKRVVDVQLSRLNEVSIIGDDVQGDHVMKMGFVNDVLQKWIVSQQALAVKMDDRTRDIFCRRAAVVGFRAAMVCFFLWGEKNTPTIRRNVCAFAIWVASYMLNQHLSRFKVEEKSTNTEWYLDVLARLGDEFTRLELDRACRACSVKAPLKMVVYRLRLSGQIEAIEQEGSKMVKFKKIKK